jgi:hypothetical protein
MLTYLFCDLLGWHTACRRAWWFESVTLEDARTNIALMFADMPWYGFITLGILFVLIVVCAFTQPPKDRRL